LRSPSTFHGGDSIESRENIDGMEPRESSSSFSTSSALPHQGKRLLEANVHKLGYLDNLTTADLDFRDITVADIEACKTLHGEWFPVDYDQNFYRNMQNGHIFGTCAVWRPPEEPGTEYI
jgi:hypothetical protein